MRPLSEQWLALARQVPRDADGLPVKVIWSIISELSALGFHGPSRRTLSAQLSKCALDASVSSRKIEFFSFHHLIWLVAWPGIQVFDGAVAPSGWPLHVQLLEAECSRSNPGIGDALDLDAWISKLASLLELATSAPPGSISEDFIKGLCVEKVPFQLPATILSAHLFCMSPLAARVVGKTLAVQVFRHALGTLADIPLRSTGPEDLRTPLLVELFDSLASESLRGSMLQSGTSEGSATPSMPPHKRSRTAESVRTLQGLKTDQVRLALKNQVAMGRLPQTIIDAEALISSIREAASGAPAGGNAEGEEDFLSNFLVHRVNLLRHLLALDDALDRHTACEIYERRLSNTFVGACIATDESPPEAPRFSGLRFQVTCVYLGFIDDIGTWETSGSPPVTSRRILCDIIHAPGKKGVDLMQVLDKQLSRLGLGRADIVSGISDGGAENEGRSGLHASLEEANPFYVRRRCLPHLAWRTADAAIKACKDLVGNYHALAAHFCDGPTWRRLRAIATTPRTSGGLGLFRDGSRACHRVFHKAPRTIIDTRPGSDLEFLSFLRFKEADLHSICMHDLEQRTLAHKTKQAVEEIRDPELMIHRGILAEVLHRCLFLVRWNAKHQQVAGQCTWEELITEATMRIRGLAVDSGVLRRFEITPELLADTKWKPRTWVELLLRRLFEDAGLVQNYLPAALKFHSLLVDKASAHLDLTASNIMRTPWTAACMLSSDACQAQAAAATLVAHIAKTPARIRTPFEQGLFDTDCLWNSLVDFSMAAPPVCLWKGRGHFQELFRLLATQFLIAPDHVLDCERQHARWQWLCARKRGVKLPAMNAFLKCTTYLEGNNMEFPPNEALAEHLDATARQYRWDLRQTRDAPDIAAGWGQEVLWANRFNLRPESYRLLEGQEDPPQPEASGASATIHINWRNYCRIVMRRGFFYHFPAFPEVYFYVSENKILAGREDRGEGEAVGRNMVLTFFEPMDQSPASPDLRVHRVDRSSDALATQLMTLAELMRTIGFVPETPAGASSAQKELALEEMFATAGLRCFQGILETTAEEIHCYHLQEGVCAEDAFLHSEARDSLTKMALSRFWERRTGESRKLCMKKSLQELRDITYPHLPADPADPAIGEARGRGRGRGRGRAATKGKGRGGR